MCVCEIQRIIFIPFIYNNFNGYIFFRNCIYILLYLNLYINIK